MKRLLLLLLVALSAFGVSAQDWSQVLKAGDGLPGELNNFAGNSCYYYLSPLISPGKATDKIRITVIETVSNEAPNGNSVIFSLSGISVYDSFYNEVKYTATSNADYNALTGKSDGDGLSALMDNNLNTYFHSMYSMPAVAAYHYVELKLERSVSSFMLEWTTRLNEKNFKNSPTAVVVTLGTKVPQSGVDSGDDSGDNGGGSDNVNPDNNGGGVAGDVEYEAPVLDENSVYVYMPNGGVEAFPGSSLDGEYYMTGDNLCIPLKGGEVRTFAAGEYDSCSMVKPRLPMMTSFKFNNKYNPNLNVDVVAENVDTDIKLSLNSIGKWLTPSFNLSDSKALAYVGTELQVSKENRMSFADTVKYVVTYPGYYVTQTVKVQDEIWKTEVLGGEVSEIALTADMLSTNKPSTSSSESLANLLDGYSNTYFHSTWGSANNATVNVNTYIDIDMPSAVEAIKVYYKCRNGGNYNPLVWEIYAGDSADNLQLVRTLDYEIDGMPTGGSGQEYTSPAIDLKGSHSYVRILQTRGEYPKNHLVLSELRLYSVEDVKIESVKVQDAKYEAMQVPFGREYNVIADWLTDKAVSVPRIDIDIDKGLFVTSKDYYLNAKFTITGYGVYDDFVDSVKIKGRGNTSWGYSKKPYRLKFEEKVKPFGLTKGKSWVLLANAQRGSLMANAVSMKIGQMAGAAYANHIIPVELYMNGIYMGSYMFTEKVGMANNSVDIDEDTGYLLELDTYFDETYKFRTDEYNLPVNVKEPDLTEYDKSVADIRFSIIQSEVNEMTNTIASGGDVELVLDMDAFARFMLANDYSLNMEINHPKSTFLFKEVEGNPTSRFKFGPIWDFDWGFGYQNSGNYCVSNETTNILNQSMSGYKFLYDICSTEAFAKHYYKVWKEFMANNPYGEIEDYIDSYFTFAQESFKNNAAEWGYSTGFDETDRDNMKSWLKTRMNHIYNNLEEFDLAEFIPVLYGDADGNDVLTIHDVTSIAAYVKGDEVKNFNEKKADYNKNGRVNARDIEYVATALMDVEEAPGPMYWYATPVAVAEFDAAPFSLEIGETHIQPLKIVTVPDESYNAIQFEVKVPDGLYIDDITAGNALSSHVFSYVQVDMNTYKVIVYSATNEGFAQGEDVIANLALSTYSVIDEDKCKVNVTNAYIVDNNNCELRMSDVDVAFAQTTGIDGMYATSNVSGGDCIVITALKAQPVEVYAVDGRLVKKLNVKEGTTRVNVPAGIYIVYGKKVLVTL